MPSQQDVVAALAEVMGPDGRTPLPQSGALGGVVVREDRVFVSLEVEAARAAASEPLRANVERIVSGLPGVGKAFVTLTTPSKGQATSPAPQAAAQDHAHHDHGHHDHSHAPADRPPARDRPAPRPRRPEPRWGSRA